MTEFYQETDAKPIPVRSSPFSVTTVLRNETLGGTLFANYLPLPIGSSVLKQAWDVAYSLANDEQMKLAKSLLTAIQQSLSTLQRHNSDLSYLPSLWATVSEDGSALFEWIFRDYRVGFGLETDATESGWYLITNKKLGDISASGLICDVDLNILTEWLLSFIMTHI